MRKNTSYFSRGCVILFSQKFYFKLITKKDKKKLSDINGKSATLPNQRYDISLTDDYPISTLYKKLVICYTPKCVLEKYPPPGKLTWRLFTVFESYVEYYNYTNKYFVEKDRCFFEVIFGEYPQKPHFDIDVSLENVSKDYPGEENDLVTISEYLKDNLIESCCKILKDSNVELNIAKDILLYSSHSSTKRSYHLVITNWCHENNLEAKLFYRKVIEYISSTLNDKYLKYIDQAVYSPRQQFRVLGSQKQDSGRPKIFLESFTFKEQIYVHEYPEDITTSHPFPHKFKQLVQLYESLVSFISNCTFLQNYEIDFPETSYRTKTGRVKKNIVEGDKSNIDIDDVTVGKIMLLFSNCPQMNFPPDGLQSKDFPFSIREVNGNIISLQREMESWCPTCCRTHEHEHPFLTQTENGSIYFNCRRNEHRKSYFIGYIHTIIEQEYLSKVTEHKVEPVKEPVTVPVDETSSNVPLGFCFGDNMETDIINNTATMEVFSDTIIHPIERKEEPKLIKPTNLLDMLKKKSQEWNTKKPISEDTGLMELETLQIRATKRKRTKENEKVRREVEQGTSSNYIEQSVDIINPEVVEPSIVRRSRKRRRTATIIIRNEEDSKEDEDYIVGRALKGKLNESEQEKWKDKLIELNAYYVNDSEMDLK